jgi:hypothetical protein
MIDTLSAGSMDPDTPFMPNASRALGTPPLTLREMHTKRMDGDAINNRIGHNDFTLAFEDIEWLVNLTDLPVVLKGVLHPDDAKRAVACGVKGVVVSNHGGRQLDGSPPAIEVLPEIVAAVGEEVGVVCLLFAKCGCSHSLSLVCWWWCGIDLMRCLIYFSLTVLMAFQTLHAMQTIFASK